MSNATSYGSSTMKKANKLSIGSLRGLFFKRNKANVTNVCPDERLVCPNSQCSVSIQGESVPFGPVPSSGITEKVFEIKFYKDGISSNVHRFFTRRTNRENGRQLIRYLVMEKSDNNLNYMLQDSTKSGGPPSLGAPKNIDYYVEVWHKSNRTLVRYPNNSKAPLLRRSFAEMQRDPLELPRDLGAEFFVKILAVGAPNRARTVKLNCRLRIECRGYYSWTSEETNFPSNQVESGTVKIINNGRY